MKSRPLLCVAAIALACTCLGLRSPLASAEPTPLAWPMFLHDPQHTGRSPYVGPTDNTGGWRARISGLRISAPVLGPDGTIYIGSNDDYLYAIWPNGRLRWRYKTGGDVPAAAAVAPDGTVYAGSFDHYFYALNPDGSLKWRYLTGYIIRSPPAIGPDGTIYFGGFDHYLYALRPDGSLRWRYLCGDAIRGSGPAIGSDGTIYVGCWDTYLYAIHPDGTLAWRYATEHWISVASPSVAEDGTIYQGSTDGYLYALHADGTLRWRYDAGTWVTCTPAIGLDGTIYVGSATDATHGYLHAIRPNGTRRWRFAAGRIDASPALGADGTIYVTDNNGELFALWPDGSVRWQRTVGGVHAGAAALGSDGSLYVQGEGDNEDWYLYAIGPKLERPLYLPVVQKRWRGAIVPQPSATGAGPAATATPTASATPTGSVTPAASPTPGATTTSAPNGKGEVPVSLAPEKEFHPDVAWNAQRDEYLVVWQSGESAADIRAQRLSASASRLGDLLDVCSAPGEQQRPDVAHNSERDEYLIVWQSGAGEQSPTGPNHIHAQRLSADGVPQGTTIIVSDATTWQIRPQVAYDSQNDAYLVVWQDGTVDIQGRRLTGLGQPLGAQFTICDAPRQQNSPRVAYNRLAGEFMVVWDDHRPNVHYDIYGQRVSSMGALAGPPFAVSAAEGDQLSPDLSFCPETREYLVAWTDYRASHGTPDVYCQRISEQGQTLGGHRTVAAGQDEEAAARVTFLEGKGWYLVSWADGGTGSIEGRYVLKSGSLLGSTFPICCPSGYQSYPGIVASPSPNTYLMVWEDDRNGGRTDIYALLQR